MVNAIGRGANPIATKGRSVKRNVVFRLDPMKSVVYKPLTRFGRTKGDEAYPNRQLWHCRKQNNAVTACVPTLWHDILSSRRGPKGWFSQWRRNSGEFPHRVARKALDMKSQIETEDSRKAAVAHT